MVELKFVKTSPNAVLPKANHTEPGTGDSGLDLTCTENTRVPAKGWAIVPVGLKLGYITPGYWFRIEARSGLGFKKHVFPHFGIIDNGYRGDLGVKVYNFSEQDVDFVPGDRIAQIVVYPLVQPVVEWTQVESETVRGEKGFGSSDKPQV